ncbi:hypothetical protein SYNTR_0857 [Candidatus Syntrophocurvum alkaliphilum]|uniref:Uncharacterized protein n=1 Tax=Candidatus Syntrophocurvum alkaliphilum TaxID=2293317 RepID=A0A6I6DGC8_9FIRM|nr:hypothetical protein [Candidatus Syntrophocurvum alkaliphilum]QGT99450.1 hypothetical protein SYNTR_0857 [Candidatus Syntrophocurvum alkaliphilum]
MEIAIDQISKIQILNQFWLALFLVIPMVVIARTVVAGTRYSPILIIVIFGLSMGYILVASGIAKPGLQEFPLIDLISKTTIIALSVSFFVGGQELRKIFGGKQLEPDKMLVPSDEETILGTNRTQLVFVIRSFFLLLGIEGLSRLLVGSESILSQYYLLIAYIGIVGAVILIDYKAKISNKHQYIRKGIVEILAILIVLYLSYNIAQIIYEIIALPQIFFAMLLSAGLGGFLYKWSFGPTIRALLFAGIPIVLAGNFMIGGSRIGEAFTISGMNSVLAYGFFGQLVWMFLGISLLMYFAKTTNVRNLAPGMAGALSHSGLTGACTAGDFGKIAANRAPIMINIPFFAHVFVFSILAVSAESGNLILAPSLLIVAAGLILTVFALKNLRYSNEENSIEVKALMQFSMGWQLLVIFGGLLLLSFTTMPMNYAVMAQTSAISHFGLFAAIQGGMFGAEAAGLIPFIFAMPFLVHPLVFFMFGKAMEKDGNMPTLPVYIITFIGIAGIIFSLIAF